MPRLEAIATLLLLISVLSQHNPQFKTTSFIKQSSSLISSNFPQPQSPTASIFNWQISFKNPFKSSAQIAVNKIFYPEFIRIHKTYYKSYGKQIKNINPVYNFEKYNEHKYLRLFPYLVGFKRQYWSITILTKVIIGCEAVPFPHFKLYLLMQPFHFLKRISQHILFLNLEKMNTNKRVFVFNRQTKNLFNKGLSIAKPKNQILSGLSRSSRNFFKLLTSNLLQIQQYIQKSSFNSLPVSRIIRLQEIQQIASRYLALQRETIQITTQNSYNFSLKYIFKHPSKNTISLFIRITNLSATRNLSLLSWASIIELQLANIQNLSYNVQNQTINITFSYIKNIHDQRFKIIHKVPSATRCSKTAQHLLLSNNMLTANFYQQQIYDLQQVLTKFIFALEGLAGFTFILGLYSSKIVVLEMIGIIQLSYFGILSLKHRHPVVNSLVFLKYSNGFNNILPKTQGQVPQLINSIDLGGYFFQNFNIAFGIFLIPLIASSFYYLKYKIFKAKQNFVSRSQQRFKIIVGEWNLFIIICFLYHFVVCMSVFVLYSSTEGWMFIASVVQISLFLFVTIGILILYWVTDYTYMGEFKYMFKWNSIDLRVYLINFILIVGWSVGLVIANGTYYAIAGILLCCVMVVILIAVRKPYADVKHLIRSLLNFLFIIGIMVCYLLMSIIDEENNLIVKVPIIIVCLLFLNVLNALFFVVKQIILQVRKSLDTEQISQISEGQRQHEKRLKDKILNDLMLQQQHRFQIYRQNNFGKRLWLEKRKKNKQPQKLIRQQSQEYDSEQNKNTIILINNQLFNQKDSENQNGLTVERFLKVDQMLKNNEL